MVRHPITRQIIDPDRELERLELAEPLEEASFVPYCTGNFCCFVNENGSHVACEPTLIGGAALAGGGLLWWLLYRRARRQGTERDTKR